MTPTVASGDRATPPNADSIPPMDQTTRPASLDATRRVKAVDRTISLLETLADVGQDGAKLADLARATDLSEATTLRYLASLSEGGFIQHDEQERVYRLGLGLVVLVDRALRSGDVRAIALPHMKQLRDEYGETVNLAALLGHRAVLIEVMEGMRPIRLGARVGESDPLHASALGKALLSFSPELRREQLIETIEFERFNENTLVTREALEADVARTRTRGYSIDAEETTVGLRCAAAPIMARDGNLVAAISLSALTAYWTVEAMEGMGEHVASCARAISAAMGHEPSIQHVR